MQYFIHVTVLYSYLLSFQEFKLHLINRQSIKTLSMVFLVLNYKTDMGLIDLVLVNRRTHLKTSAERTHALIAVGCQ